MKLRRIISGGQTGADQGGWLAAKAVSLETGGWMPRGFLTEAGPRPEFARLYGAREHSSDKYPPRTYANVAESDATIWFGRGDSRGFACTENATLGAKKPLFTVLYRDRTPEDVALLIDGFGVVVLNVAGNRESMAPGIQQRVAEFLVEVVKALESR